MSEAPERHYCVECGETVARVDGYDEALRQRDMAVEALFILCRAAMEASARHKLPHAAKHAAVTLNSLASCDTGIRPPVRSRAAFRGGPDNQEFYDKVVGSRFGRLTVLGPAVNSRPSAERNGAKVPWVVQCDCGAYEVRKLKTLRIAAPGMGQMCRSCADRAEPA